MQACPDLFDPALAYSVLNLEDCGRGIQEPRGLKSATHLILEPARTLIVFRHPCEMKEFPQPEGLLLSMLSERCGNAMLERDC
jgi:hypothetical protein